MVCSSCGFDSPSGMLFCGRCGTPLAEHGAAETPLPAVPESSGAANDPALSTLELPRGERRNVTVLFADLSGFTSLSEQLDPEEMAELLQDCFNELQEEVHARDGWIEKFIGDALLAVFGAPVAHENDPIRAVRVALAMQARMRSINRRMEGRLSEPLQLHIGINTGLVVTGPGAGTGDHDADGLDDFKVIGDAVNVGARLQQLAAPGQVLVGESTHGATTWAFDYRRLGPLEVKGKHEQVVAYECLRPRAQPLAPRGFEDIQAMMLGRGGELQQVFEALNACREGRPQIVSIVGDAGIGKSRLISEFLGEIKASEMLRPEQCWMAFATTDRPEPFGVARQLFASAAGRETPGTDAERLWRLLDPTADESNDEVRYLDPEHRKQRLHLLAHEVVAAQAIDQPLLLVVEDLHWADASSLDLLRSLAARPGQLQLMFLLSHRSEFAGAAVWSTRASVHSIALAPLSTELSLQLVRTYFGEAVARFPPTVQGMLVQRAEGNPFYLEELVRSELVRSLVQRGVIEREERWQVTLPTKQAAVPGSIQGLLLARMDSLDAETRLVLQEAAVLGQIFPAGLLYGYVTLDRQFEQQLDELIEGEWLERVGDTRGGETAYRFGHTLMREVAYESLLVRARAALHSRAARVIEALYRDRLDEYLPELAEHYYRARDVDRGVAYLERAGDQARMMYANAEAATCYQRALELIPETRGADRTRFALALGDVLRAQGAFDEAVASWQQAMDYFEANQALDEVGALHRRIANALWSMGRIDEAQQHLAAGLSRLDAQLETPEAAALYQELASQSLHRGDSHAAVEWAQRALDLSQQLGVHEQAALAANTLGVALARAGDVGRGQRSVEEALQLATEHDLPLAAGRAAANLAVLYANTDPLKAAEICERGLAEAHRVGDVVIQPWFYTALAGALHACAGDYETAIRSAETAIDIDRQLGLRSHLPVPLIVLAQIHQCYGRLSEAEACYQEALDIAEELADPQLLFPCLEGLGTVYLEHEHREFGQACLQRARNVCEAAGFSVQEMVLLPFFY